MSAPAEPRLRSNARSWRYFTDAVQNRHQGADPAHPPLRRFRTGCPLAGECRKIGNRQEARVEPHGAGRGTTPRVGDHDLDLADLGWHSDNPRGSVSRLHRDLRPQAERGPDGPRGLDRDRETELFEYDTKLGETVEELAKTVQFTVGVVVQRARVLRTRAKFDEWGAVFLLDVDPELVDEPHLEKWLAIGGKRIGLGDWRPEKSGKYGRFELEEIEPIDEDAPLKNRG